MRLGRREESVQRPRIEHAAALLGFLIYQTGDRSLAEEIVADTVECAEKTRGGSSEKTWLFSVALDRLCDIPAPDEPGDRSSRPALADRPDSASDRELIGLAMRSLSAEDRTVLALHFGGRLSPSEIAELLEERERTIEARLYRGSRRLRDELRDSTRRDDVDPRATFTATELDELRVRLEQLVRLTPRQRLGNGSPANWVAILAAIALLLTAGAGAVLAAASIAGSPGHGVTVGSRLENTFGHTSFHGTWDASYCQFLGPYSENSSLRLHRGILEIALLWNCGHLIVHATFPGRFSLSFEDGPSYTVAGSFYDVDAPADSLWLTVSAGGSTFTLPFRVTS